MFTVSKVLLMSSAATIVQAGGCILLKPFAIVLFVMCSAVVMECSVLYPCCDVVLSMLLMMYGRKHFSIVFATTERSDMVCKKYHCLAFE